MGLKQLKSVSQKYEYELYPEWGAGAPRLPLVRGMVKNETSLNVYMTGEKVPKVFCIV